MGKARTPDKVCLITAICYSDAEKARYAENELIKNFGKLYTKSKIFPFQHTSYYDSEMGNQLQKYYCSFKRLIDPALIADIKLISNKIEENMSVNATRTVNIDPGYIEKPKLVLATTKNFSHRIYLKNGIYGDVELYWRHGAFRTFSWTYPDYKSDVALLFFTKLRNDYIELLKLGRDFWE